EESGPFPRAGTIPVCPQASARPAKLGKKPAQRVELQKNTSVLISTLSAHWGMIPELARFEFSPICLRSTGLWLQKRMDAGRPGLRFAMPRNAWLKGETPSMEDKLRKLSILPWSI